MALQLKEKYKMQKKTPGDTQKKNTEKWYLAGLSLIRTTTLVLSSHIRTRVMALCIFKMKSWKPVKAKNKTKQKLMKSILKFTLFSKRWN